MRLGDGPVGRLLDQQVVEVEPAPGRRARTAPPRTSPLAARARRWRPSGPRASVGQQLGHGLAGEVPADDGGPPQHRPLARGQQLEAGGQQGLDGRPGSCGLVLAPVLLAEGGGQLLQEQRVAGGDLEQPRRWPRGSAGQRVQQRRRRRPSASGPSSTWIAAATPAAQPGAAPAARAGQAHQQQPLPGLGRRRPRPGRGRSARPSAGPRGRPPAGAAGPASPAAGGSPRRSRGRPASPARPGSPGSPPVLRTAPAEGSGQPLGHPGRVLLALQQRLQLLGGSPGAPRPGRPARAGARR